MLKRFVRSFALIGLCLLGTLSIFPIRAVILEWDPNTETNLAGYKVYYGLSSRNYTWTNQVNAPLTTATVTNLQFNRTYFFAVTAFDTDGLESEYSDEVFTTVLDPNVTNSIPVAMSEVVQTFEDQSRSIVLTGSDADADDLQFQLLSLPLHGTLAGAAPHLIYTPDRNFYGADSFLFVASDGRTNSAPATIFLSVSAVNDRPTLDSIGDLSVSEDSGATVLTLRGISSGASDEVQNLAVTATSLDPSLIPHPTVGYVTPSTFGTLTFRPVADAWGTATIVVRVSDGFSTFTRLFSVSVSAVNDPPTLDPIANVSVSEDSGPTVITLSGISSGLRGEAQALTVTAASSNPSLILHPTVAYSSPNSTAALTFTPASDGSGTAIVTVTVSDRQPVNGTFRRYFYITVNPLNDPPIVSAGADQAVTLPAMARLTGSATDDGFPNPPHVLTTSWSKLSGPGSVIFSAPDNVISTASFSQPGQYVLRLAASDGAFSVTDDLRVDVSGEAMPTLSDLAIVAIDARTIMVSLRTDEPAVCSTEFGTNSLGTTNVEPRFATGHVMVLTNLQPEMDYFARVRATDVHGNTTVTGVFAVSTPPLVLMAWAADAGELVPPMSIASSTLGAFVWSPRNEEGAVSFDFQLPIASQYRLWCQLRTYAPDVGSFYVSIGGSAEFVFDAAGSDWQTGWRWMAVNDVTGPLGPSSPWAGFLSPGRHRLVLRANEAVTLLHQVVLSNDPDWVPY